MVFKKEIPPGLHKDVNESQVMWNPRHLFHPDSGDCVRRMDTFIIFSNIQRFLKPSARMLLLVAYGFLLLSSKVFLSRVVYLIELILTFLDFQN